MRNILILALLAALPGFGALQFTLSPNTQITPPGGMPNSCFSLTDCVIYSGTIDVTPDDSLTYFLNGIDIVFNPANPTGLTHEPLFFLNNVPGAVDRDFPYTGPIFEIDVGFNTAPNIYLGTATLRGGQTMDDLNALGQFEFELIVTPEPAYVLPIAIGCLVLLLRVRRR